MEVLSDDDAVVRIFNTGNSKTPYAAFYISTDGITAISADSIRIIKEKMADEIDWTIPYIASEQPGDLDFDRSHPFALSGTHLFRCISNKKPFKQKMMSVPETDFSESLSRLYEITPIAPSADINTPDFFTNFSSINTLLISDGPKSTASVPTEPTDRAHQFFAVYATPDLRFRLEKLLAGTANLSLTLLSDASVKNAYLIGHLFAVYGCPGVVFFNNSSNRADLIENFLKSYTKDSGIGAIRSVLNSAGKNVKIPPETPVDGEPDTLIYLGYQGMTSAESKTFARKHFIRYVKTGRSAFDQKNYTSALVLFENAIFVAKEIKKYDKYLPDLYKFGRESAYRSGNMESALLFAKNLADLTKDIKPESKAYAEALLRLGLMYSKLDDYENAIPVIESSVNIMSSLTPDEDLIKAMVDLGIVLENATNYETARRKIWGRTIGCSIHRCNQRQRGSRSI